MDINATLRTSIRKSVEAVFGQAVEQFQIQPTNPEFEGSYTLVTFPLTKISKKSPEETSRLLGEHLVLHSGIVSKFNVVTGFLNLSISDRVWIQALQTIWSQPDFGSRPANG